MFSIKYKKVVRMHYSMTNCALRYVKLCYVMMLCYVTVVMLRFRWCKNNEVSSRKKVKELTRALHSYLHCN